MVVVEWSAVDGEWDMGGGTMGAVDDEDDDLGAVGDDLGAVEDDLVDDSDGGDDVSAAGDLDCLAEVLGAVG